MYFSISDIILWKPLFSQHHGWETVMTGKTILLLSAAAAGVLALFIAVRIYDPVHEIPVSLKIKNDTDGTIRDCLLICNQREKDARWGKSAMGKASGSPMSRMENPNSNLNISCTINVTS